MTKLSAGLLLATVLLFTACNNKPTENQESESIARDPSTQVEDASVLEESMEEEIEETLNFEEYNAQGFTIERNIKIYDKDRNCLRTIEMPNAISTFQIIGQSSKMYSLSQENKDCSRAYFMKIKMDKDTLIADGSQIYTYANEEKIYRNIQFKENSYSLYSINPFTVGASDEDGLTGCDDFETLIIEDEKTESRHFIDGARDDYYADKNKINYYYFRTDEGVLERIALVEQQAQGDCIIAHVDVGMQEGRAEYDLLITEHNGSFHWEVANEKKYDD